MNKEEILAAARENGFKGEEYEKDTMLKGDNLAFNIGMIAGIILFFTELIVKKQLHFGLTTMLLLMSAVQAIHEGIKLKKKLYIIVGIGFSIMTVLSILGFIGVMVSE